MGKSATSEYRDKNAAQRERQRLISAAGRDIGAIPKIENLRRRNACKNDLAKFCRTYNPIAFEWEWSDDHLLCIQRIEEAVFHGAKFAFAMPRGSGKSTLCRMATLWAISYAHVRYVFVIGANAPKAQENLEAIKVFARFLDSYAADFPEISAPVRALNGIANRASGQTCGGKPTMIEWSKDKIVLPTVPPPANLKHKGEFAPTSGSIIGVSGLTGDGIRGSLHTLMTGEQIRPDFVLLDDPQTDESADSEKQNEDRERLISGAVLGMAGPGKSIAAVMPCTVIRPNDMVDRILDRKKHPTWRGERTAMLTSWPTNLDKWDPYFEIYDQCLLSDPPDLKPANRYYRKHRKKLDDGAAVSWQQRKLPDEVSAIQHAMNLWHERPEAFMSEYQNEPTSKQPGIEETVTATTIVQRTNGHDRRLVPIEAEHVTMFVDVQKDLLFYVVAAWAANFTGFVVDYGTYPEQKRSYFQLRDAKPTLSQVTGIKSLEGSVFAGLEALCGQWLGQPLARDGGSQISIERLLIDANWGESTDVVYQFARQTGHRAVVTPSHGRGVGASGQPFNEYKRKPGERVGDHWRMPNPHGKRVVRHVVYDTNHWKSFIYSRLATPKGERGALTLFGEKPQPHRLFASHLVAEFREPIEHKLSGRVVDEWKWRPERPDNHWLDGIVGCAVGASMLGVGLEETSHGTKRRRKRQRVSFAEMQRRRGA